MKRFNQSEISRTTLISAVVILSISNLDTETVIKTYILMLLNVKMC